MRGAMLILGPARLALLLAMLAAGGAAARAAPGAEDGRLEVVYHDFPPYVIARGAGAEPAGLAVDLLRLVAEREGLALRFTRARDPGRALAALREGAAQLHPALSPAPERAADALFTRPVASLRFGLYLRRDRAAALAAGGFEGARLGAVAGSRSLHLIEAMPGASPISVGTRRDLLSAVLEGRLDGAVLPETLFRAVSSELLAVDDFVRHGDWLAVAPVAMAVSRGAPRLHGRLESAIGALKPTAAYAQVVERWFGAPPPFWTPRRVASAAALAIGVVLLLSVVTIWQLRERSRDAQLVAARDYARDKTRLAGELARKNAELELRNRDMESLLGVVSHDLKSPLVSIGGFARRLQRHLERGDGAGAERAVERIMRNAEAMTELIDGLLNLGRAQGGPAEMETLDLESEIARVGTSLSARLEAAGARLEVEGPLPRVRADPVQLRQALQNLVENALRHACPAPGMSVRVHARRAPEMIEIGVSDSGPGVPPDQQTRIFDLYQRAAAARREGAGLGLATVRRIAERHGGRAYVDSRLGAGATFWIAFPAGEDQDERSAA